MASACPYHLELPIVAPCPRCGAFVCDRCVATTCGACLERSRLDEYRAQAAIKNTELVRETLVCGVLAAVIGVFFGAAVQRVSHSLIWLPLFTLGLIVPFFVAAGLFSTGDPRLARVAIALEVLPAFLLVVCSASGCSLFVLGAPARARLLLSHIEDLRQGKRTDDPHTLMLVKRARRRRKE